MKKRKTTKKEFELTPRLRVLYEIMMSYSNAQEVVSKPIGLFNKKIDTKALMEISKRYGEARADFWIASEISYPEISNKEAEANCFRIKLK